MGMPLTAASSLTRFAAEAAGAAAPPPVAEAAAAEAAAAPGPAAAAEAAAGGAAGGVGGSGAWGAALPRGEEEVGGGEAGVDAAEWVAQLRRAQQGIADLQDLLDLHRRYVRATSGETRAVQQGAPAGVARAEELLPCEAGGARAPLLPSLPGRRGC